MPRRLDPEERARRAKARSQQRWADMRSGAAYKQYDPRDGHGRGSEQQWQDTAERIRGGVIQILHTDADLELLGLTEMPKDQRALDRAYRLASRTAHPDAGGTDEKFIALTKAYERLSEKMNHA